MKAGLWKRVYLSGFMKADLFIMLVYLSGLPADAADPIVYLFIYLYYLFILIYLFIYLFIYL